MKKTGGATFNADEKFLYFFATGLQWHLRVSSAGHKNYLVAVNHITEGESGIAELEQLCAIPDVKVFLDSGIFTLVTDYSRVNDISFEEVLLMQPDALPGYDKLKKRYIELIIQFQSKLWGFVELDLGGTATKQRTRAELEARGLNPIPVFHPMGDSWEYYDHLITEYDRICFSDIKFAAQSTRATVFTEAMRRRRVLGSECYIHVLGASANALTTSLRADSCDSSSWNSRLRFPVLNTINLQGNLKGLPEWFLYEQNGDSSLITKSGESCAYQSYLFNEGRQSLFDELYAARL